MTKRSALPYSRSVNRPSCNVEQAREHLSSEKPPSRQHVYRLFHRGDLDGYFLGAGRGLRIYLDSIQAFVRKNNGEALIADGGVTSEREAIAVIAGAVRP